jgi:ceramide synthetase
MTGFFRIGTVILLIHEVSDPFMEIAKMFFYLNYKQAADIFFALFAIVFIITRNLIFPYYVIASIPKYCYHEDGSDIPYGKGYIRDSAFIALCILEVLHIYWAALILKMVKLAVTKAGVQGDIRNEDD